MHIRLSRPPIWPEGSLKSFALALLLGPCMALANCVVPPGMPDDDSLGRLIEALPECQRDASYLAALGNILNQRGRYVEAGDHLERALMLSPDLSGARLDYAISLAGMGETESARQLIDDILRDATLPANIRPSLERERARLAPATDWQSRFLVNARVGHDSNLLGAPNLASLTLTFPGQPVVLPLDESARPKAGAYQRVDVQLEVQKLTIGGGQLNSFVSLRSRRSNATPDAQSHQGDASFEYSTYQRRAGGAGFYSGGSISLLDAGSGVRYNAYGVVAGLGSARFATGCETRLGAEIQERKYLNNEMLSGRYTGLGGWLACDHKTYQWLASLKGGIDNAAHDNRAGGDQAQYALRAALVVPSIGWGANRQGLLWTDFELNVARDRNGYSPLLESGRSRVLKRLSARVEFQHPLASNIHWAVGGEWVSQRSNLELFTNKSWGPYLALRRAW
jgi:tetratricopeptide (TPR) repeat protein